MVWVIMRRGVSSAGILVVYKFALLCLVLLLLVKFAGRSEDDLDITAWHHLTGRAMEGSSATQGATSQDHAQIWN